MGLFSDSLVGIDVTSGFKLQAQKPLDVRAVVSSDEDLAALVTENGAYEGMLVYNTGDSTLYINDGSGSWDKVFNNSDDQTMDAEIAAAIVSLTASGNKLTYVNNNGDEVTIAVGSDITVDDALDTESSNPVQNKVIAEQINSLWSDNTTMQGDIADNAGAIATNASNISAIQTKISNGDFVTGISGTVNGVIADLSDGSTSTATLTSVDASLLTGTIDIARLPASALERCVVVADDDARFALTTDSVQLGDTVKVTATELMYMVVDTDNLSNDAGYEVYNASVSWANVVDKPEASSEAAGLMSAADKAKLDAIEAGATAITVDEKLDESSPNPVQNAAVYNAVNNIWDSIDAAEANISTNTTNIATNTAALAERAVSLQLTSEDLDTVTTPGFYYANSVNTCANKPVDSIAFGMEVIRTTSTNTTTCVQTLYQASPYVIYRRWEYQGSWNSWTVLKFTDTVTTVDTALSETSTNPVQNAVITVQLNSLANDITEVSDAAGDAIASLSVSGMTITYTLNNGNTGTIDTQDTTYSEATTTSAGLMSADDKQELTDATQELYGETYGVVTKITASDTGFEYEKSNGTDVYSVELPQIYFATSLPETAPTGSICCVIEE